MLNSQALPNSISWRMLWCILSDCKACGLSRNTLLKHYFYVHGYKITAGEERVMEFTYMYVVEAIFSGRFIQYITLNPRPPCPPLVSVKVQPSMSNTIMGESSMVRYFPVCNYVYESDIMLLHGSLCGACISETLIHAHGVEARSCPSCEHPSTRSSSVRCAR